MFHETDWKSNNEWVKKQLKLIEDNSKEALDFLQIFITTSKTDVFRRDVTVTVGNTRRGVHLNPLRALLKALSVRIEDGEKLLAGSFVFGILEKGKAVPLKGTFSNDMFGAISEILFQKKGGANLRTHSLRKGGATSLMAARKSVTEVRLLGRWSLKVLNFYLSTEPHRFVEMQQAMARWAENIIKDPRYIEPLHTYYTWFI